MDLAKVTPEQISELTDDQFAELLSLVHEVQNTDIRENNLRYYEAVSPDARKVHLSKATYVGVGGGNGCLPLHAPVLMSDGSWKKLGDIQVGDSVMGADPVTGLTKPSLVTTVWRSGVKPVYRVTYSDGGWFEATAEHKVPMYLGSGRTTSKGNPKEPHKRVLGDYLEAINVRGAKNPSKRISCVSPLDIQFDRQEPLLIDPYLLGCILGDGSISSNRYIKFSNKDQKIIDRLGGIVKQYGLRVVAYEKYDHGITGDGGANDLLTRLRDYGLSGRNSFTKFIPEPYFSASREDRKALLAGLIDTDGSVDEFTSVSKVLAEGVCRLVRSLGGKASLCLKEVSVPNTDRFTLVYRIYMRLNDRLPLCLDKQAINQRGKEIDYRRRICRRSELVGEFECGDIEVDHSAHCYITSHYTVVSNSGKSETAFAEMAMCATGVFPDWMLETLSEEDIRKRCPGPMSCRVVIANFKNQLKPLLKKFRWDEWTGVLPRGGKKGHWGWIPRSHLIDGDFEKSWIAGDSTLKFESRDPYTGELRGYSTIQFMSKEMDPLAMASVDIHFCILDEPPTLSVFRENYSRVMRGDGRLFLVMTWIDDPGFDADWIYEEMYDKAMGENPDYEWFTLKTYDNPHLNLERVMQSAANVSETVRKIRFEGGNLRFSNRIHPLFTDVPKFWCFSCQAETMLENNVCAHCKKNDVEIFCHVKEFDIQPNWPTVFILDPHPRKPHMFQWVQVDPSDDLWQILDGDCEDTVFKTVEKILEMEDQFEFHTVRRLMDPNMGASVCGANREITWQTEFQTNGIFCELADDSSMGRGRLNEYIKPDPYTRSPRFHVHPRCEKTITQLNRYMWDNFKQDQGRDVKQIPKPKYDDYPNNLKYLVNSDPTFKHLKMGFERINVRHRANKSLR